MAIFRSQKSYLKTSSSSDMSRRRANSASSLCIVLALAARVAYIIMNEAAFHIVSTWNNRVFLETQHFAHLEPLLDRLEPRKYGRSLAPSCAVKKIFKEEVIPATRMRRRDYYAESAGVHSM